MEGFNKKTACILITAWVCMISGCGGSDSIADAGCPYDGSVKDGSPCGACRFYNSDSVCGAPSSDAGTPACGQIGDLSCYDYCSNSSQCKDPSRPNCSILGLFNGGDWNCNASVKVCRAEKDDDCPN